MAQGNKPDKIVIVDDDEDLLRLIIASFKAEGFDVVGFATGKQGLAYLMEEKNVESLSLLILDRMLTDMDGMDILKQFKAKYGARVPVLILSVLGAEKDVMEGFKKGAVDYIPKPFSLPILIQKARALASR